MAIVFMLMVAMALVNAQPAWVLVGLIGPASLVAEHFARRRPTGSGQGGDGFGDAR